MPDEMMVNVSVFTDNPEHVSRSVEAFARAAAGLALEGVAVHLHVSRYEDEDAEL